VGLGFAILGYGAIAEMHANSLLDAGAQLVSVTGPDLARARAFAARHGVASAATTFEEAVDAPGVDVVLVASPNTLHAGQARRALEAGRHVLVEIPLAMSLDDGAELAQMAAARGLRLGVCHTMRFAEPYVRAMEHLASSGDRPHHVIVRSLSNRQTDVGWTGRRRSWTDDLLWHHGGHVIDLALRVLGDPESVARGARVQSAVGRPDAGDVPLDYSIQLTTADGRIGSIALSYTSLISTTDLIAIAAEGSVEVTAGMVRTPDGTLWEGDPATTLDLAVARQDAAFIQAVQNGVPFGCEATSILPTLLVQAQVDADARASTAPDRRSIEDTL
jgi:2-hydroxy-4-carboxymuconate semialdehyde hemiacetal dehydrogenase